MKLSDVVFMLLVGVLTFMSRINFMLSLVEHEKMYDNLKAATRLVFVCSKKETKISFQDQLSLNAPRGAFCNTFDLH